MKLLASLLAFVLIVSTVTAQTTKFQIVAAACNDAMGYPFVDRTGGHRFDAYEPYQAGWKCVKNALGGTGVGLFFLVISIPGTQQTLLPSHLGTCSLQGTIALVIPRRVIGSEWSAVYLGLPQSQTFDVLMQGVFALFRTGVSQQSCPLYLSTTPRWRVTRS